MTTKTFSVPSISCSHCTRTIEMEVGDIEGVKNVQADEQNKMVTVEWDEPANWDQIESLLVEIDFAPAK